MATQTEQTMEVERIHTDINILEAAGTMEVERPRRRRKRPRRRPGAGKEPDYWVPEV